MLPDEYSRPVHPRFYIHINKTLYERIKKTKNGLRLSESEVYKIL